MADSKKYNSRVPSEYQEVTYLSNNYNQYINPNLKGSDLANCEIEIVMKNLSTNTTEYNFNGVYEVGKSAQLGLVATSATECRASINFGFSPAISVTNLPIDDYHTIYVSDGLQKVDGVTVGTSSFGTLSNENFLIFARTNIDISQISICPKMSLKSFTVKKNNQYIRNMIPVKRLSDNTFGLYDLANSIFYTNQGTGSFTVGSDVNNWQHSLRKLTTATDTLTTLPADLYADGNNATVGLVGNMQQTGTPTPQNPIQPQETGERTGNLYNGNVENWGISTVDGSILSANNRYACYVPVEANKSYSISRTIGSSTYFYYGLTDEEPYIGLTCEIYDNLGNVTTATITNTTHKYLIFFFGGGMSTNVMINEGQPMDYQPYGYKIPISSASTTTPVYLGEVETTRKIYKTVLTGQESWNEYGTGTGHFYYIALSPYAKMNIYPVCSHYSTVRVASEGKQLRIYETYESTTAFTTYLQQQYAAGTPVTIWYVLATVTTGIVNEPIRKIGDYADTVSGIAIPTITGADSFDVLTTLKPSEVSLAYTGWHDASVGEWDGSQWQ